MSNTMKPSANPTSNSDSLFGMALAQAFIGVAFGVGAEQIWDAGEAASAAYVDRTVTQRTNGNGNFTLGVKNSLADGFTRMAQALETPAMKIWDFAQPKQTRAFAF